VSGPQENEEIPPPKYDGPDPHQWMDKAPKILGLVLDIEMLDRTIKAINGGVPEGAELLHEAARDFLVKAREGQRAFLAEEILHTYRVQVPEETAEPPTEAVGGFRGDSDGPGDRDHV
jgi:hypothetical protein